MKTAKAILVWAMPCMGLGVHSESYKVTGETFSANISTQKVRKFLLENSNPEGMRERKSSEER